MSGQLLERVALLLKLLVDIPQLIPDDGEDFAFSELSLFRSAQPHGRLRLRVKNFAKALKSDARLLQLEQGDTTPDHVDLIVRGNDK